MTDSILTDSILTVSKLTNSMSSEENLNSSILKSSSAFKKLVLASSLALLATPSFGKGPESATPKKKDSVVESSKCSTCESLQKTRKKLEKLNVSNSKDRAEGDGLVIKIVPDFMSYKNGLKTNSLKKDVAVNASSLKAQFEEMLLVALHGAPFDGENQMAQILADDIHSDKATKAIYESFLKDHPSLEKAPDCKLELIKNSIAESLCMLESNLTGSDTGDAKKEEAALKCIRKFNFNECIDQKSKIKTEKK